MSSQRTRQSFGAQKSVPTWLFAAIVVAALALIRIVVGLEGFAGIGGFFAYIALIGVAAFLWGADSRDSRVNL